MAKTTVEVDVALDDAWPQLQDLATWEGVAGIEDLHDATFDDDGNLASFNFAMETIVGRVEGTTSVEAERPVMTISADEKGLRIMLRIELAEAGDDAITAEVEAKSKATGLLSKPLAVTLNALLEASIDDEAAKIVDRLS